MKSSSKVNLKQHPNEGGIYIETSTGTRLRPNTNAWIENHVLSHRKVNIRTNSIGYRNPEIGKKTKKRILFLGDSVVFEDYLEEKNTCVRRIENNLLQKGIDVETINAGVGAVGTMNELAILQETGLNTEPDIVVLVFALNDFQPSPVFKMMRIPDSLNWSWLINYIFKYASIIRSKIIKTDDLNIQTRKVKGWINEIKSKYGRKNDKIDSFDNNNNKTFNDQIIENVADWGLAWSENAWTDMQKVFNEFLKLSQVYNFKFCIIVYPPKQQVDYENASDFPQIKLKELGKKSSVPVYDLLPFFKKIAVSHKNENLFYDRSHPTEFMDKLIADELTTFLAEQYFIKKNR